MPTLEIAPNVLLPMVGFGTWRLYGADCKKAVRIALETGYRHIDTAHLYENHVEIAKAIQGFPREELFLTSKFMLQMKIEETVSESLERALRELKTDYLDAFLMHYPDRQLPMNNIFEEMVKLKERGLTRSIGVSNFTVRHLQDHADFLPEISINQVEYHPYLNQKELFDYCTNAGIHIVSYRSLGQGRLIQDSLFAEIGTKYSKTAAQVSLRFLIQKGIAVIPKATSKKHMEENIEILDFELSKEDFERLDNLPQRARYCEGDISDFNYV